MMTKGKKRVLLVGGFVMGYLVIALVVMVFFSKPEFDSPPDVSRDTGTFRGGSVGLFEEGYGGPERGRPAAAVMAVPERTEGSKSDFLLEWRNEEEAVEEEVDRWVKGLVGDDEMELVAFATWYPMPDDEVDPKVEWEVPVEFRNAATLEVLGGEELDRMGVPAAFRAMGPAKRYVTPKLRLLFKIEGMDYPRVLYAAAGDKRTGAQISYDLESWSVEKPPMAMEGGWMRYDMALLIWHDTPFEVAVQVLTGDAVTAALPQEFGAQVVLADRLRLQWLGTMDGHLDLGWSPSGFEPVATLASAEAEALRERMDDEPVAAWIEKEQPDGWTPKMVLRASSSGYLRQHAGVVRDDGSVDWGWDWERGSGVELVESEKPADPGTPVKIVLVPQVTELGWELGGIPGAPNQEVPENLFDVLMPRVTLDADGESSESELIGLIGVATQIEWDHRSLWDEEPGVPAALPSDRTFRNVTPRDLMHWYLDETRGARVTFDPEEMHLEFNEEKRTLMEWWDDVAPDWFWF